MMNFVTSKPWREAEVRLRQVIEVTFNRGKGVEDDPVRRVTAYHDEEGNLLAENDPVAGLMWRSTDPDGTVRGGK